MIADCGRFIYHFAIDNEGDGLLGPGMHRAKELMLTGVAAIVIGNNACPKLTATVQRLVAPGGLAAGADGNALLATTCAKATRVLEKLESMFGPQGKLHATFEFYEGASLVDPVFLRAADIGPPTHEKIDKLLTAPALTQVPGLRAALIDELPQYYVLAEHVAPTVDLLQWWYNARHSLPTWYRYVLPEVVMMQPTSATVERVFSMLEWMFRDNQRAALEDYKETALMLRYNQLQRQRAAPARLVELD